MLLAERGRSVGDLGGVVLAFGSVQWVATNGRVRGDRG
ncbi:Uncharacterized protein M6B38_217820 [Iris pallida]|uniref:Uncharacterized protein n=1 Tax=Iris pallida TaxID=29817 RepID=A0AAX6E0V5_IRIPA|nr:Uncharacterized protein M6B38_217820 [Iris pallida]